MRTSACDVSFKEVTVSALRSRMTRLEPCCTSCPTSASSKVCTRWALASLQPWSFSTVSTLRGPKDSGSGPRGPTSRGMFGTCASLFQNWREQAMKVACTACEPLNVRDGAGLDVLEQGKQFVTNPVAEVFGRSVAGVFSPVPAFASANAWMSDRFKWSMGRMICPSCAAMPMMDQGSALRMACRNHVSAWSSA